MAKSGLNQLTAFVTVARHRSFRAAADYLGISRSSLSHAVMELERRLGVRLLNRTTRSVAPTEAGAALLQRLDPILRDLDDALVAVAGGSSSLSGTLRINCGSSAAALLLQQTVPAFLDRYPQVTLDLVTDGQLIDIVAAGFDAGVRLAESVPQDMIAVPFGGPVRFLAVAAPSYLTGREPPRVPDDLFAHACIRQRLPSGKAYRWEFERQGQELAIDVPGTLILDDTRLMVDAAVAGLGIAFVPEGPCADALSRGQLVCLLEDWSPPFPGLCLYYPGHRNVPTALRAFIDLLKAGDKRP